MQVEPSATWHIQQLQNLKNSAITLAAAALVSFPAASPALALGPAPSNPAIAVLGVLIAGQPIKEPNALLRYALPISNKAIKDVQFPLELITEDLRVPGLKALDSVERVRLRTDPVITKISRRRTTNHWCPICFDTSPSAY